jgi:hypothetical protein
MSVQIRPHWAPLRLSHQVIWTRVLLIVIYQFQLMAKLQNADSTSSQQILRSAIPGLRGLTCFANWTESQC